MSNLTYINMQTAQNVTIDVATASIQDIDAAYTSLIAQSDCGGAFPGSKRWQAAQVYVTQLDALIALRPEIEQYRTNRNTAPTGANIWSN